MLDTESSLILRPIKNNLYKERKIKKDKSRQAIKGIWKLVLVFELFYPLWVLVLQILFHFTHNNIATF